MDFFPTFGEKNTWKPRKSQKKSMGDLPKITENQEIMGFSSPHDIFPKGAPGSSPSAAAVSSDPPGPGDPPAQDMTMNSLELFVHLIS